MDHLTPAEKMNRAGAVLTRGLRPFIEENAPTLGSAESWIELLKRQDAVDGRRLEYDLDDPRVTLKILSSHWKTFRTPTTPGQTAMARNARDLLNKAAHVPHKVSILDFYDFLGTVRRLLQTFDRLDNDCVRELEEFATQVDASSSLPTSTSDGNSVVQDPESPVHAAKDVSAEVSGMEPSQYTDDGVADADADLEQDEGLTDRRQTEDAVDSETEAERLTEIVVDEEDQDSEEPHDLVEEARRRLSVSAHGLEHATVTIQDVTVVFFYRASLNFGLIHNSVSPLAGIALINEDEENARHVEGLGAALSSLDGEGDTWKTGEQSLTPGQIRMLGPADLSWPLPAQPFVDLDEAMLDTLIFSVLSDGVRHQVRRPVRLLAHDEWDATTVPELLAAYVRPRSAAVSEVLERASDVLRAKTGDPSFVGYQAGSERARETAAAIFEALSRMNIRYTVPPASFEETGQKIRRSESVLETRFGTCLDLTLLYAAVLEEAGLHPTITMMSGHALVGVLTEDLNLTSFVVDSADALSNLHGSTFYVPIETTLIADGHAPDFEGAVDRAMSTIRPPGAVTYVLDVAAAHRRVRPLPVVRRDGEQTVIEHETTAPPVTKRARRSIGRTDETAETLETEEFPRRVQAWRNRLLDLTFRNPLLNLADRRGIELLLHGDDLGEFEDMLASGKKIPLTPSEDVAATIDGLRGYESAKQLPSDQRVRLFREEGRVFAHNSAGRTHPRLNKMRRDARTRREETGANTLYVALGMMRWKDSSGRSGRSPMFLLPCQLEGSTHRPFTVSMDPDASVQPNYCLIEKLRIEHDLEIPELRKPPLDNSGIDLPLIVDRLRQIFVRKGLDGFSIEDTAFLAILEFSTLDLWRDISENWLELAQAPVVEHLIERPGETFEDSVSDPSVDVADEVDVALPMPADGSQLQAIKAASAGKTFVLEGPPGTGKSQTITNMIADGLAKGRRILFVAEKQAALNVVYDRLRQVGLDTLVLNVHGQTQTLKTVRAQLREALTAEETSKAVELEELQQRVRDQVNSLADYPRMLHSQDGPESVWNSYQRCLSLEHDFPENSAWRPEEITADGADLSGSRDELLRACKDLMHADAQLGHERLPASLSLVGDTELDAEAWNEVLTAACAVADAIESFPQKLVDVLSVTDGAALELVSDWFDALPSGQVVLPRDVDKFIPTEEQLRAVAQQAVELREQFGAFLAVLLPQAFDADLGLLRSDQERLRNAGFGRRRRTRNEVRSRLRHLVLPEHANVVTKDPDEFIEKLIRVRNLVDGFFLEVRRYGVAVQIEDVRTGRAELVIDSARGFFAQKRSCAAKTASLVAAAPGVGDLLPAVAEDSYGATRGAYGQAWERFLTSWNRLVTVANVSDESLRRWQGDLALGTAMRAQAPQWSTIKNDELNRHHLVRQHRHWSALRRLRALGLTVVADEIEGGRPVRGLDAAVDLARQQYILRTALARTGLEHLKSDERRRRVDDYMRLSYRLRMLLRSQIAAAHFEVGGSSRTVSVGLRKETDRRRGGSIRGLFNKYGEEILGLTPCVLMSPSSVARHLDIGDVRFDTVIFDEASQIPVADAVGALGRADAAVIVGDSKQLPPTAMFAVDTSPADEEQESEEDDEDVLAAADQESILSEAVGSGLDQKLLSWHYRSRDETLISFSNEKYYDGELSIFPSPPVHRPGFGVTSHYVGGTFERGRGAARVNREEADVICRRIREMIAGDPHASIGVVTFNTQQRDLILDRLEQDDSAAVRRALERDEDAVFVKNLENVQGDERDTILFSLAFSRDPKTGVMPLNFGPLNKSGGERRLNVAVTRARQSVELYTSFRATDIELERTRSEGLRHLREYLAYAESSGDLTSHTSPGDYDLYREQIENALRHHGLEVSSDIGTSKFRVDLAVRVDKDHGWLAVLLDTPEWAARLVTADREALPSAILENVMGWQATKQILMPDWLRSPEGVVERISERAGELNGQKHSATFPTGEDQDGVEKEVVSSDEAMHDGDSPVSPEGESSAPEGGVAVSDEPEGSEGLSTEALGHTPVLSHASAGFLAATSEDNPEAESGVGPSSVAANLPRERPYQQAPTGIVGTVSDLDSIRSSRKVRSLVRQLMHDLVQHEGPIEADRAARLVGRRFGLDRVVRSRIEDIQAVASVQKKESKTAGTFYWPTYLDPSKYRDYRPRADGAEVVQVHEIAPEEIANAMEAVLRRKRYMEPEDLIRETMAIFGYVRMGQRIRTRFGGVLDDCLDDRRLRKQGDHVSIVE